MNQISYLNQNYQALPNETVLDCLTRNQVLIPHSCKIGSCQSCMLRLKQGTPSPQAQKELNQDLIQQNVIFSCQQKITEDLVLEKVGEGLGETSAIISQKILLSDSVSEIALKLDTSMSYQPGQFITLIRPDGLARSYSVCQGDHELEIKLHIRKIPSGKMSSWLCEEAQLGDKILIRGPLGRCYYREEFTNHDIILAGTGTGLAPLYGIILSALKNKHQGQIHLFHGALNRDGLYFVDQLKTIESLYNNFHYTPCVMQEEIPGHRTGNLIDIVNEQNISPSNAIAFFCGDPQLVKKMKTNFFLKGVSSKNIYSDPFVPSAN